MDLELKAAKALVTGGTRGVGRGIVRALVGAGADVITCYRQEGEAVASLERELMESADDHHVVRAWPGNSGRRGSGSTSWPSA